MPFLPRLKSLGFPGIFYEKKQLSRKERIHEEGMGFLWAG
jgi:hypothetical protein